MRSILTCSFLLLFLSAKAQIDTTYAHAQPKGGIEKLALSFYDIEFTPEQRTLLNQRPIELHFFVSDEGAGRLESVNGIRNRAIIDSLFAAAQSIPDFVPATRGGAPVQSLYSMKMTFPTYQSFYMAKTARYGKFELEEFDTLSTAPGSLQVLFGGLASGFVGNAGSFLGLGGGIRLEIIGTDAKGWYYGMNMTFTGNNRLKDYELNDEREQENAPGTLLMGGSVGKRINKFMLQADLDVALQNIITINPNSEEEPVQFWGFSPGVIANFPISLGSRVNLSPFNGMQIDHYLNLHAGYRHLFMGDDQGNGGMWELGLSYRFASRTVYHYKLSD